VTRVKPGYGRSVKIGTLSMRARDSLKGVAPNMVAKLRKMIALLDNIEDAEELQVLTAWKVLWGLAIALTLRPLRKPVRAA
jgi:hypothetical protein